MTAHRLPPDVQQKVRKAVLARYLMPIIWICFSIAVGIAVGGFPGLIGAAGMIWVGLTYRNKVMY